MKIAVCQLNSVIGDLELNKKKILEHYFKGVQDGVDLVICPELSLPWYTPQDLVEKEEFRNAVSAVTEQIAECTNKVGLIFGTITEELTMLVQDCTIPQFYAITEKFNLAEKKLYY
jgi:NAD+ synthase (glutamine-hydrolysing)